jgi:hypothetical protein
VIDEPIGAASNRDLTGSPGEAQGTWHRAWAAVWSFGLTLLVFGVIVVVMLARVLREGAY